MKNLQKIKQQKKARRHRRVRAKIKGTAKKPRLSVFRSNKYIYGQLINDKKGETLASANSQQITVNNKKSKNKETEKQSKTEAAKEVGKLIAKKALERKIKQVVFDRGGYKYHGRIKAVAEGAREEGLNF